MSAPLKVIVIDDDPDMCALTQKVLVKFGHEVNAFCDSDAGIAFAKKSKLNLILMDIMLPGLSGPELVISFQKDPQLKNIPVVFLTGLVSGQEKNMQNEGIEVGGKKYPTLGKPYEIEQLLSVVKKYAV